MAGRNGERPKAMRGIARTITVRHDRPKQLWVRSLVSGGRKQLRAEDLPAELASVEAGLLPRCTLSVSQLREMTAYFRRVADWRKRVVRYPQESLLAVVLL